jgi:CspA family cold shock protein
LGLRARRYKVGIAACGPEFFTGFIYLGFFTGIIVKDFGGDFVRNSYGATWFAGRLLVWRGARRFRRIFVAVESAKIELSKIDSCGERDVATGTAKWFNIDRGYGFIVPNDGEGRFCSHLGRSKGGYTGLVEGVRISYELVPGRSGKTSAENLRLGWLAGSHREARKWQLFLVLALAPYARREPQRGHSQFE